MKNFPLHLVPIFLDLAQNLNISRTSERIGLSQPALSRQLRALEEALGVSLFLRQSRGLVLTQAGRQLKKDLEPAFEELQKSLESSRLSSTAIEGPIVLGCLVDFGQKMIAPLLYEFVKAHPGIELDVRLMSERDILNQVSDGQISMGVATQIPSSEMVRAHPLLNEKVIALTSAKNEFDLEKHQAPKFVGYRGYDPLLQKFLRSFPEYKKEMPARVSVAVNSHTAMIEGVATLGYYAVLPLRSAQDALATGSVRIASKRTLQNKIYLLVPDHDFKERRYLEIVKFLLRRARELERADEKEN